MAEVIKAPNDYLIKNRISLFLGGAINQGAASNWQDKIAEAVQDQDILILNPRRDDWDASWKQSISDMRFFEQVHWELNAQEIADVMIYVFAPDSEEAKTSLAPITLLELGLFANSNKRILVCCPDNYWRKGNVEIICDRYNIPLFNSLDDLIVKTKKLLTLLNE